MLDVLRQRVSKVVETDAEFVGVFAVLEFTDRELNK